MLFIKLVWPQEEGRNGSKKSQRKELLTALGVGILIEGLIAFAMVYIGPAWEAIDMFLMMLLFSLFLGVFHI